MACAVLGVVVLTVAACGAQPLPAAPAVPATPAASPTATPTVAPTDTSTPAPTLLPTWTPAPTPVPGVLYVDPAQDMGAISPLVYGSNYGPWMPIRPETLPLAEQAGLTLLRFPGGEWGDQNDLQGYHIDQFVDLARRMGAQPMIHVRLPGSTPEQAAALVQYTQDKGYDVRYWAIGNEPSLYQDRKGLEDWDTVRYNAEWRKFAEAMRAVDPEIVLFGPEVHQWTGSPQVDPKDKAGRDWLREFLKANGDLVDIVAIHRYPFPNNAEKTSARPDELRANAREWNGIVRNLRQVIRDETRRDLPVAVTEANSHWTLGNSRDTTPDSLLSALWWADVLGRLISEKVDAVAHWNLASGGESGHGMLAKYEARPAYYVYQLYKHFGGNLVYSSSDDPMVSIYVAKRDDGALTLMLVNLASEEKRVPLRLDNFEPGGPAEVWRFDAEHKAEQIESQEIVDGTELVLSAESATLIVMPPSTNGARIHE